MNRRYFIIDKFNSWYDWRCTLTSKSVPPAEPKFNYVEIEGANGSLDFSEALTGEPVYSDRTVKASFVCSEGTHKEREALLRRITTALHGRKVPIIEPDDPDHYFLGRVRILEPQNHMAYLEFTVEATCDPWRYAVNETTRYVALESDVDVVIRNEGDKTLIPVIAIDGVVTLTHQGVAYGQLLSGSYKITDLRLVRGVNVVSLSGYGSVTFTYREAVL